MHNSRVRFACAEKGLARVQGRIKHKLSKCNNLQIKHEQSHSTRFCTLKSHQTMLKDLVAREHFCYVSIFSEDVKMLSGSKRTHNQQETLQALRAMKQWQLLGIYYQLSESCRT